MAIGNQTSAGQINAQLGNYVTGLRNLLQEIANDQMWLTSIGGATGLQAAPISMSAGDAAAVVASVSYLNTIAGVFFGTVTQGSLFNFDNALAGDTGGS